MKRFFSAFLVLVLPLLLPEGPAIAQVSDNPIGAPDGAAHRPYLPIEAPSGDISGPTLNGLLVDGNGAPGRFIASDSGDPILYLVDTNALPSGITPGQALGAVSNAFAAWSAASSLNFAFAGVENFGKASAVISTNDGIIRVQLHDLYNYITNPAVLGMGGHYLVTTQALAIAGWGLGGNVAGSEFDQCACGYVVMKHTNTTLQVLSTFTEVLCHEIGHALGFAHSSENLSETNSTLKQAIMYIQCHADGRGAALKSYDTNIVLKVHPVPPPPFSYNRFMDVTVAEPPPAVPGINQIEMRGYDLQGAALTVVVTNATELDGSFTNSGNLIEYVPNYVTGERYDPAEEASDLNSYDLLWARHSDGTNSSPYVTVRVLSLSEDNQPYISDGIPDYWMIYYFGHAAPEAGDKTRALDDYDGDGMNNLTEYRAGMNPTNALSAQRISLLSTSAVQWQAKAYELYELQSSPNLTNWTRVGKPIWPTNAPLSVRTNLLDTSFTVTVSNLPAAGTGAMYYRVLKVP